MVYLALCLKPPLLDFIFLLKLMLCWALHINKNKAGDFVANHGEAPVRHISGFATSQRYSS